MKNERCWKWNHRWEYSSPSPKSSHFRHCVKCRLQQVYHDDDGKWWDNSFNYGVMYSRERVIFLLGNLGVVKDPSERVRKIKFRH